MYIADRLVLLILLSGAGALPVTSLHAQPGRMDQGFGIEVGAANQIAVIVPTAEGNILLGGGFTTFRGAMLNHIARLNSAGELDGGFQVGTGASGSVLSIAIQNGGKIVIGGSFSNYNGMPRNCIARLNADGSLDKSFDPGSGVSAAKDDPNPFAFVNSIAVQPDEKILVAGMFARVNGLARTNLARLNPDGSVDTSFQTGAGPVIVRQVLVQNDGRILVAGVFNSANGLSLARLNRDGSLDGSFGASFGELDLISQMVLQPDGKVIVVGSFMDRVGGSGFQNPGGFRVLALRLNPDGSPDPNFIPVLSGKEHSALCIAWPGGFPVFSVWDSIAALGLQDDGKIVVGGSFSILNGMPNGNIARLNPDGTLEGNFDAGTGADGQVYPIALEKNGNVLLTGCFQQANGVQAEGLIRLFGGEPAPSAPVFKIHPVEQVLNNTVVFAASITAFPSSSYQWQLNGVDLPGAMHSELIVSNLSVSNAGNYQLLVTNLLGSAVSEPVVLRPPDILVQPLPQTVREGQDVLFSVLATNSLPLSFQWQFEGTNVIGATNATLGLSGVRLTQVGTYRVVVSDSVGSVASTPIALTVLPPTAPDILLQPLSQTVEEGVAVSLFVVATNYLPLSYQWQFNSTDIPGATQATLNLPSVGLSDSGLYRAIASSEFRSSTSAVAVLKVNPLVFVPGPGIVTNLNQACLQMALSNGTPVSFGVNGTIRLTNTILITANTTLDGTGRSISLDGNNAVRQFAVTNGATLRLVNLTLINGRFVGAAGQTNQPGNPGLGGAIYNSGGALELVGCKFISNSVLGGNVGPPTCIPPGGCIEISRTSGGPAYGGAIYSTDGQLYATNCLFVGNQASGNIAFEGRDSYDSYGGAIFSTNGVVELESTTFTNNVVFGIGGAASGGAIADVDGTTMIVKSSFMNNFVYGGTVSALPIPIPGRPANGGAVYHDGGSLAINGSQFLENQVVGGQGTPHGANAGQGGEGNGGALCNNRGELTVRSCVFAYNQSSGGPAGVQIFVAPSGAGLGGAILSKGTLGLENSTLVGNIASGGPASIESFGNSVHNGGPAFGGGIFNSGGPVTLLNVTLANNIVTNSDTTELASGDNLASTKMPITLTNTILFHSQSKTNVFGPTTDGGHNISSDTSANFTSSTSRKNTDPLLAPLTDNGGPTPTMALLPGSPAIDAGDDSACPPTDQRGVTRPQGLACDIGAFELAPKLTLARGQEGVITIDYAFQAGRTNRVTASTDLVKWVSLGTRVSDANGMSEYKDSEAKELPRRFYRIEIPRDQ